MRIVTVVVVFIAAAVAGAYLTASRWPTALDGLVQIREYSYLHDAVFRGQRAEHSFMFRNATNRTIVIERAFASAHARVEVSKRKIKPREAVVVTLTTYPPLDGQGTRARFSGTLFFVGVTTPLVFTLQTRVADAYPRSISLGDRLTGARTITYDVLPVGNRVLRYIRAECPQDLLRVDVIEIDNGTRLRVTVRTENLTAGRFSHTVKLITDDTIEPQKRTVITGRVLDRIICSPDVVSLGVFRTPKDVQGSIHLSSPYGDRFSIASTGTSTSILTVESGSQKANSSQSVIIRPAKLASHGSINGKIMVVTAAPKRHFSVPVHGLYVSAQ